MNTVEIPTWQISDFRKIPTSQNSDFTKSRLYKIPPSKNSDFTKFRVPKTKYFFLKIPTVKNPEFKKHEFENLDNQKIPNQNNLDYQKILLFINSEMTKSRHGKILTSKNFGYQNPKLPKIPIKNNLEILTLVFSNL